MERTEFEDKIDRLLEIVPIIEALGAVLVRRHTATKRAGLGQNTITANDKITKFEEIGAMRKTYIEIGELSAIKQRKGNKKRNK